MIQYHYTRKPVKDGRFGLAYVPMKEMLANLLTKPLPRGHFLHRFRIAGFPAIYLGSEYESEDDPNDLMI